MTLSEAPALLSSHSAIHDFGAPTYLSYPIDISLQSPRAVVEGAVPFVFPVLPLSCTPARPLDDGGGRRRSRKWPPTPLGRHSAARLGPLPGAPCLLPGPRADQ